MGSTKRSAAYRFHRNFTYPLSDLIACDVFTLGRWLVGSIIIFRAGHCHDRSHPQFAAFRCSSPRRICTWCLSMRLSKDIGNISSFTITPKCGQWNSPWKIFLIMHKIRLQFLCDMLISYQNAGKNRFWGEGRGTKSAPPASFLSHCCGWWITPLRQLPTSAAPPHHSRGGERREKTLKSITIDPLRRKQYTILNKYLFKYKNIFVEIDKVIIDKHPVT